MPIGYLLVSTETGHAESVLDALKKIELVKEAYMVYGTYDIIAKIETQNMNELKDNIINIRLLEKVQSTQTMIVMDEAT